MKVTVASVSIDELLSGEKLVLIAEKENSANIQNICNWLMGITDLLSCMLIVLPLYPKTVDGYVYSVNLWWYTETAVYNRTVYWVLFLALIACGLWKLLQTQMNIAAGKKLATRVSFTCSILTVLYLVFAREVYAAAVAILLMLLKGLLLIHCLKTRN